MKLTLRELRSIILEYHSIVLLTEATCPGCGDPDAYVGLADVECPNEKCNFFTQKQKDLVRPTVQQPAKANNLHKRMALLGKLKQLLEDEMAMHGLVVQGGTWKDDSTGQFRWSRARLDSRVPRHIAASWTDVMKGIGGHAAVPPLDGRVGDEYFEYDGSKIVFDTFSPEVTIYPVVSNETEVLENHALLEFEAGGAGPDVSADESMSGMFQASSSRRSGSRVGSLPSMEHEPDDEDEEDEEEEHEFWMIHPPVRK